MTRVFARLNVEILHERKIPTREFHVRNASASAAPETTALKLPVSATHWDGRLSSRGAPAKTSAVFIGELHFATCSGFQRSWALEQCEVDVFKIDTTKYRAPLSHFDAGWARLSKRFQLHYDQKRLETDILEACAATSPALIWFEWPRSFQPTFIQLLKSACPAALLISFQDDNPFGTRYGDAWQWKNYISCIPLFDLHLVKRQSDVHNLKAHGARNCRLWMHGVYTPLFVPPSTAIQKRYPVSFIGTCFDDRPHFFEFLIAGCNLPVHVFGSHWNRRSALPRRFPHLFHSEVTGPDYAHVIHQSTVCIALLSNSHRDEWSLRTFEIPGCAGMLLAKRTPVHEALFREGAEAMFFSNVQECATAIRALLAEPERAKRMGEAAYARCVTEKRYIETRMAELLADL